MSRYRDNRVSAFVAYLWIIAAACYFALLTWAFGHGWGAAAFIATLIWLVRRWLWTK